MSNLTIEKWENWLKFYDGETHQIDRQRIVEFEVACTSKKFYQSQEVPTKELMETLGPYFIDFSDLHPWGKEIPDINDRSSRLFTLWAENTQTKEIECIIRGHHMLMSSHIGGTDIGNFYEIGLNLPYFPWVLISNFRTKLEGYDKLRSLIDGVRAFIDELWVAKKKKMIEILEDGSEIWKRHYLSFDKVVHYSIICPTLDRDLIRSLQLQGASTGGILQIMSLPSTSFDGAMVRDHIQRSKKLLEEEEF